MDNVTHSFVGIALADLMLRRGAPSSERRLVAGAGIIAANLPDIDLAYSALTPAPLGYLVHHRGHTHTVAGLIGLAMLMWLAYRAIPSVRRLRLSDRARLWGVIAVGLASHLLLDALNSYGVHPFYPVDVNWYYGDAVFIFEPWLWVVLGVAAALNTRRRLTLLVVLLLVLIFPPVLGSFGIIPPGALVALAAGGVLWAWYGRRLSPRGRAGFALAATVLITMGLFGVSRIALREATDAMRPDSRGRLLDVILTPNPSSPLCWAVIGVELNEGGGEYVLRPGTLSLAPGWKAPVTCASYRLAGERPARTLGDGRLVLTEAIRQPLSRLRQVAQRDCRARAWLQFGRAPVIAGGAIFDLRFERAGLNFTKMVLSPEREASRCPPNLTHWSLPRADLLSR